MCIVVTGGTDFIGNFVLDWMAHYDVAVKNLDKLTYAGNPEHERSLLLCEPALGVQWPLDGVSNWR